MTFHQSNKILKTSKERGGQREKDSQRDRNRVTNEGLKIRMASNLVTAYLKTEAKVSLSS